MHFLLKIMKDGASLVGSARISLFLKFKHYGFAIGGI